MSADYLQYITSIATLGATVGAIYSVIHNLRSELKSDIHNLRDDMKNLRTELKAEIHEMGSELKVEMHEMRSQLKDEMAQIHARVDRQDNRMFQLAMGKSYREILREEKIAKDPEDNLASAISGTRKKSLKSALQLL